MLRGLIGLSAIKFLKKVCVNVSVVTVVASIIPFFLCCNLSESFSSFILISIVAMISTAITVFAIGCDKSERTFIIEKVKLFTSKIANND